ncbi:pur operon repressor [Crassaminicella thermophila]|uniref:Pur operon repressor n=1 Tax=Crassaminicella thermophila TaxID=2599308 RepID=A0A5C0S955_CRATE|nr:pur operon repressor [Crassaminicella thermophila]QEK11073.1 pur operon repressor [Crassaminicella thermophila]
MKIKRNGRIGALIKILCDNPNKIFTLSYFTNKFNAAKSSISEDIVVAKRLMEDLELGRIETIPGAAGGVKYIPLVSRRENKEILEDICEKLSKPDRIIPGAFIYMADIIYDPTIVRKLGEIFATQFKDQEVDYVITVETKGIPIAIMTANALNVPLVILRRDSKVTEGSTVSINYISGSTGKIQTMSISKRAIKNGANVIIIDDFMKAGGTAKGMMDMMNEFDANVVGVGVMIATKEPKEKIVKDYVPLLILDKVDEKSKTIHVYPNEYLI